MMEEDKEQKYICRFCNKSCASGKSLGGHMRVHLALISAKKAEEKEAFSKWFGGDDQPQPGYGLRENHEKVQAISQPSISNPVQENEDVGDVGFEDGDQSGYGLRENPKKSWRVSDSKHGGLRKKHACKECGKGFSSLRALSGHMRCHSTKNREEGNVCQKCGKRFDSMRALFGHMRSHKKKSKVSSEFSESQSDFESLPQIRKKRSRTRYNTSPNSSISNSNANGRRTEIDDEEDAAMCLLMMSRSIKNWVGFNSATDSSDNNSVAYEAQSLHQGKRIDENGCGRKFLSLCDIDVDWKMEKHREEIVSYVSVSEKGFSEKGIAIPADSDTGFAHELPKSKNNECPICFKVFASGRALGGHKRAHYTGFTDSREKEIMLNEQEVSNIQNVFDLNLPSSSNAEENDKDDNGYKAWWIGNEHEGEALLISLGGT